MSKSLRHRASLLRHGRLDPAIPVFVFAERKEDVDHRDKPGDDEWRTDAVQPSRDGFPPEWSQILPPLEGVGNAGRKRTRSLVCKSEKTHELVTTSSPASPAFPHANGFNGLWRALPGDRAFCHRFEVRCASIVTQMPASRHQDHTLSPSAKPRRSSLGAAHVHRIPAQRFVTIAKRPLLAGRDGAKL
jgi:hypothetical protein